jgi:hypothetical protein
MAEGRPLHGEGIENLQDYVEERLTYAGDTDEYAAADRTLEQELADLQALHQERGSSSARPNLDALIDEAQLRVDRLRGGAVQERASGGQADPDLLPPESEARQNEVARMNNQNG